MMGRCHACRFWEPEAEREPIVDLDGWGNCAVAEHDDPNDVYDTGDQPSGMVAWGRNAAGERCSGWLRTQALFGCTAFVAAEGDGGDG